MWLLHDGLDSPTSDLFPTGNNAKMITNMGYFISCVITLFDQSK